MEKRISLHSPRFSREKESEYYISAESFLRKQAYRNIRIKVDAGFFDDSDMESDYFLTVLRDEYSGTPLLSCRHYFSLSLIEKFLRGEKQATEEWRFIENFKEGEVFLADRLSGNIANRIYRENRDLIFKTFYEEIRKNNVGKTLILMVRKEKRDMQLKKYLNLGFTETGSAIHRGREHSVIHRKID